MNVDYQVVTVKNQIKSKDIGGRDVELDDRKDSGNYDKERTQFNIEYVGFDGHSTLSSKVYETIYTKNINFNKNDNTNILNGCIVTSGPDFFRKLELHMKDTERVYVEGNHAGEFVFCPDIKYKEDIPEKMLEYFNKSYRFLSKYDGEENVVYSAIHFDEDTPHMHFYFIPVVNEVHRKVFETDSNGHQILKSYIGKDGKEKLIRIQKKDENGKNLYSIEKGKFLNCDQFWKDKGFKTSFDKIQDDYNKFITSKGFNLDRGQIGGNKYHQTKAEKYLEELQEENKLMELELNKNKALNEVEISYKEKISNVDTNPLLNPEKGKIIGYKEKDINNLSKYSKEITKYNLNKSKIIEQNEIKLESKQKQIDKLNTEIKNLKSGKTLLEKDKIIENQNLIIKEKDETINYRNNIIESLKEELTNIKEMASSLIQNVKGIATDLYKALKRTLGLNVDKNQEYDSYEFKNLSKKINKKYELDKSDDFEL